MPNPFYMAAVVSFSLVVLFSCLCMSHGHCASRHDCMCNCVCGGRLWPTWWLLTYSRHLLRLRTNNGDW